MTLNKNAKDFIEKQGLSLESFAPHPAANLFTIVMSPYYSIFAKLSFYINELKHTEVYYRSADHPINGRSQADNTVPGYGMQAHLGLYKNSIQHIENLSHKNPAPSSVVPETTSGDGKLHAMFINYQLKILEQLMSIMTKTQFFQITPGVYNEYPCLMVHIKRPSLLKNGTPGLAAHEAWVELWGSFFIAYTTYLALSDNYSIEMVRRSSFGHLRPSLARTGESLRINLGMVPMGYALWIPVTLHVMDRVINYVLENANRFEVGKDLFIHEASYRKYIGDNDRAIYQSKNLIELLFNKAERGRNGQKTIQSLMRTAHARQLIAANYMVSLLAGIRKNEPGWNAVDLFMTVVSRSLQGFKIKNNTFTMEQGAPPTVGLPTLGTLTLHESLLNADWVAYFETICTRVKAQFNDNHNIVACANELLSNVTKNDLEKLYNTMEVLHELIYADSVVHADNHFQEDGFGSDSEGEQDIGTIMNPVRIYRKKTIVHNGMRAIVASIVTIARYVQETNATIKTNCYIKNAYFEVEPALTAIGNKWGVNTNTTHQMAYANVIVYDMNACLTSPVGDSVSWSQIVASQKSYYILDVTSSNPEQVTERVHQLFNENKNIKAIFLVSSGLKLEQLGADKNHYGVVRVLSLDKQCRDKLHQHLRSHAVENPTCSAVAHHYRRAHKKLGSVPSTADYLRNKLSLH